MVLGSTLSRSTGVQGRSQRSACVCWKSLRLKPVDQSSGGLLSMWTVLARKWSGGDILGSKVEGLSSTAVGISQEAE